MKLTKILTIMLILTLLVPLSSAETWTVGTGGDAWDGNTTTDNTTEVQATGNIELRLIVDDYVSYWRFFDNSTVDENTTSGNDGTNYGATYTPGGKYGGAFYFDGVDDYVDCGNDASLDITEAITVEAWVKPYSIKSDSHDIIVGKGGYIKAYLLDTNWGDYFSFVTHTSSGTVNSTMYGASDYVGQWIHLVGTYDKNLGLNQQKLDLNGSVVKEDTQTGDISIVADNLYIGGALYNGTIDEVRIYNRALTPTEINQTRYNEHYTTGNLTSVIVDSGINEEWFNISFYADIPGNTSVDLYVNTSEDNITWTGPQIIQANASGNGTIYSIPIKGQYAQWTTTLHKDSYNQSVTDYLTPAIINVTLGSRAIFIPITNLTAESGETWISWTWDTENTSEVSIYLDGQYINNSTLGQFGYTGLNQNEKHQITLVLNDTIVESTAYTKKASFENNFIYILLIAIAFWLLGQKFRLFTWLAVIIFFYGGITSLSQTTESWIILTFWLGGIISIFSISIKEV